MQEAWGSANAQHIARVRDFYAKHMKNPLNPAPELAEVIDIIKQVDEEIRDMFGLPADSDLAGATWSRLPRTWQDCMQKIVSLYAFVERAFAALD